MGGVLKTTFAVVCALFFLGLGIAHLINSDRFIRSNYGVRKGGELLTEWNRIVFQVAGLLLAAFGAFLVYELLHG